MAGNSQRRGAVRKDNKKAQVKGSGGNRRRGLAGRGATPRAEDRSWHPAGKRKEAREKLEAAQEKHAQRRTNRSGSRAVEVIAGRNAIVEALRSDMPADRLYVASRLDHDDRTKEILEIATERGIAVVEATRPELDELTDGSVHQGVAMGVPAYEYLEVDDLLDAAASKGQAPLLIALDSVTDPRNLGAILRAGGAFGAHGVIVPERRAAGMTASAWKVSAGAAARVPVARVTNLVRSLEALKKSGCFVVGLDGDADSSVRDLPFAADPLVLVVGSEGKGLSRLVRETCDAIAAIPISTTVESLNAAVAAGITLYEVAAARSEDASA
ncbi:23S rRNA (guanosine(2251)-2'-O)-methyltransferase RlmB [Jonesia denitrificans]|uniref:RNA methyltransferase, TrmH family, group 3 n=1 Tax=Jonesia denitrificans (strain ATCC 14870 / DSM 20603 / BCRC 15368 / CIP 55.134 / JCM 11481 / NBRC 15587 / NCTC 10816 / Prevot 55134) TaxID=471856 RepID=C7R0Y1_JONDD|nr:23S rRNA (guanosine(2251)-2'-O)-methyltransferase RlmB [Jonesia denitrificans]ACV09705.1 RNA methyltransferase, TrmH family, group 3 [Jonesia denitrificans DSM 20603]ASE09081.1 23S rRNA (guanosine(2251)-2'-O)-methyltransferase RlmB [Jonesia denitrificans]QXB43624.1 23S rRNA (guanosine(2251)-2'-O)-methyltransferase RlmB [Jonesia denitrificans]SQH22258.1 23S rRNA (guanosine-2'-O-)-methyltransferase RlmB [Jonesia denitrificans]